MCSAVYVNKDTCPYVGVKDKCMYITPRYLGHLVISMKLSLSSVYLKADAVFDKLQNLGCLKFAKKKIEVIFHLPTN